jgi:integrase
MLGKHLGDTPPKRGKTGWNPPENIREAYRKLMADDPIASVPEPEVVLVCQVCDLFLEHISPFAGERPSRPAERRKREKETGIKEPDPALKPNPACDPRTYWWYDSYLQDFCKSHGALKASELKPIHVTRWLDAHPEWTTGRRCAITAVKRPFNWAAEQGVIPSSPIKSVKKPPVPSRARVMTRDERKEILTAIPDEEFRLFVEAMQESGCRPSEVSRVTAADVNLELGVWVLHRHKTSKKTGQPRVVYLTPRLAEITKHLMEKHPDGALFRGPRSGKPFGMHGICSRFRRLRLKLPHLKDAIAYAYRHSFATDALTNGVGVAQVAELMGHKSTDMVLRHYGHLADQIGHMKEAARKATA